VAVAVEHLTQAQLLEIQVFLAALVEVVHLRTRVLPLVVQDKAQQVKETLAGHPMDQTVNHTLVAVAAAQGLLGY
jgi:hypothetical protein